MTEHHRVLIAGTGFSGIGTAIRLLRRGERDFLMLEKATDVGGTWQANTYPGCACDIPSHLYSLSYAPNPNWTRFYPRQPEIEAYLRDVVDEYGLRAHCRLGVELLEARWDDDAARWLVSTSDGDFSCDVLVSGVGGLSEPRYPDIPGLADFEGPAFHSARWDHSVDLTGKRVAVIGTGASAIQFVPEVQKVAGHLDLYQRTPPWILPRADWAIPRRVRDLMTRVPAVRKAFRGAIYSGQEALALGMTRKPDLLKPLERRARAFIASQIEDPALREKVTPTYRIGCKRILTSNAYYPALTQPNVDVVSDGIREIRAHSIVAGNGTERQVDAIVYGTGFHVTDVPLKDRVRGHDGRLLADAWDPSMQAHQGITVAGFPNFFILLGPNTGLGHNSIIYMIESQIDYVMSALDQLDATGAAAIEVTPEAQRRFVERVDALSQGTVWTSGGCASWYIDATGRNSVLWPDFTFSYRRQTRQIDPAEFTLSERRAAPEPVAA